VWTRKGERAFSAHSNVFLAFAGFALAQRKNPFCGLVDTFEIIGIFLKNGPALLQLEPLCNLSMEGV